MQRRRSRMESWKPRLTADGSPTLVHPVHGQACHSDSGAWLEACRRYAEPCRLSERARERRPVRLLDIGTGLGWNLAAALEAVEREGGELDVETYERDSNVIRTAIEVLGPELLEVPHEACYAPVRRALENALQRSGPVELGERSRLHLHLGDARGTLPSVRTDLRFDAVFLDPFSPQVEPELWSPDFLAHIAARMAPGSWLSTYSASLAVRAALASTGLRVGPGPAVGRKAQGTLASPDRDPGPFDARTTRKLARRLLR